MVKAIRLHKYGGPEQLRYEEITLPEVGPGEARIRHTAIGVNFADIHNRTGRYPLPSLPHVLGGEAAGVIEAVGSGVSGLKIGDRVSYAAGGPDFAPGAYADARVFDASRLIPLPDEITDVIAAAMMTKGITAQYLLKSVFHPTEGDTILVWAAAGGVGQILCQWAAHLGCRVIGVVGSQSKVQSALRNQCHHVLVAERDDIVARVRQLTGGAGASAVFDSIGKMAFHSSLKALRPHGTLISFGSASGPIPPLDVFSLNRHGSLGIISPGFSWFVTSSQELHRRASDLIDVVLRGIVRVQVNQLFKLEEAAAAHRSLEERNTVGASVLLPS